MPTEIGTNMLFELPALLSNTIWNLASTKVENPDRGIVIPPPPLSPAFVWESHPSQRSL
jgi:hypothetical protein